MLNLKSTNIVSNSLYVDGKFKQCLGMLIKEKKTSNTKSIENKFFLYFSVEFSFVISTLDNLNLKRRAQITLYFILSSR